MERSFKKEVHALKLGDGETFHGEGILAVTKALLQSGVSYVGGYQGAPVSHLLDVLVDAEDIMSDLGVHLETCSNEASAAAMLGASINYPLRGAVTWKSIVGTNVAADALSNLSSPGVIGGAMIILGKDYGEGASVIQERSYAYALKSSMWLLDPRPNLPTIVRMAEEGFELSEASHAPVMMELRIRACHVTGEFKAKANRRAAFSGKNRLAGPPRFDYGRLAHPPVIYSPEGPQVDERPPTAQQFIRARKLNEVITPNMDRRPIAVMGDGGFWHNGLITGVASNLFNKGDGVLIVMKNGYASATGQQYLPSSAANRLGAPTGMTIEQTLRSLGVKWLRTVRSYSVAKMTKTLEEAMRTAERGLKVIIADGECQLARQRRVRAEDAEKLKRGKRVVRVLFGVDDEICTGDHSCIRLSGCPWLTLKPQPGSLRRDPVATVIESCVGCGLCGEVAHAAVLCPSFYRAEIIRNATWADRLLHAVRRGFIALLGTRVGVAQ